METAMVEVLLVETAIADQGFIVATAAGQLEASAKILTTLLIIFLYSFARVCITVQSIIDLDQVFYILSDQVPLIISLCNSPHSVVG